MHTSTKTAKPRDRQTILDEINALLRASGGIDETRAKQVRKAIDALRTTNSTSAAGEGPGAEDNELDVQIDAGLETLRSRIHKQVERRNRDFDKAHRLMDELESALGDNELQQAERAHHALMSILGNIPGLSEQRWKDIEKRLNRARPRLRKLESWRHWGTTRARHELINQVAGLKEAGLPPEKLAAQIKQARAQWHAWDKSGDNSGKALWKAFDQACEEAYRPCVAYFEQLRQQRAENLRQRQAIIDSLHARFAATDWKQPDWRELDKAVNHARRDFYKIGNVDFRHRKPLARALDEVLVKFEEQLCSERERSLKARERLIHDIEALGEVTSLREALDRLEALKERWKITVTGKRELENRLWKRFQAACDQTYRRRDAERKQQDAERHENLQHRQALIGELNRASAAADAELLADTTVLARVRQQWEATGPVPRKEEKALENRWRKAQQQFTGALEAAQSRARAGALDNLARRAALCHQWEQAVLAGNAPDAAAIEAEWQALPALPGAFAEAIRQRFSQALNRPDDTTLANNHAAKQAACLRLEVLLELESPGECQNERMAYQVERLSASLKKDAGAQDSPEDLLLGALTTGAVPAGMAAAIEQRIGVCLARYKQRT